MKLPRLFLRAAALLSALLLPLSASAEIVFEPDPTPVPPDVAASYSPAADGSFLMSESALAGNICSCLFEIEAPVGLTRTVHEWQCVNQDLNSGLELTLDDLFTDPAAARARMEAVIEEEVLPLLSPMVENRELTPVPESFYVDGAALLLCYPGARYRTLSDKAGCVRIRWSEVADLLDPGMAARIGVYTGSAPDAERIAAAVKAGLLPGIPVQAGSSAQAAADRWHLAEDPDLCTDGLMLLPDNGIFRQTWLLCNAPGGDYTDSTIRAIRSDCLDFYGLITGKTTAATWRQALGDPAHSIRVDTEAAEANRLVPGSSDYYEFGSHLLRLHADEEGVLRSIVLLP